jgi:predicted amidohydrolase
MNKVTVACVQPRMSIFATREEFEAEARRYLRQAQAKAAHLTIFPEQAGVMLAPQLISGVKRGFVARADQSKRPGAGFLSRRIGGVSKAAAGAMGGGFRGSMERLVRKKSDLLRDLCFETFGSLAREFATAIVAGSLYLYDEETDTIRNRAYVFNSDGEVLGYQDKLNLAPDEQQLAAPGTDLPTFQTRFGRFGLLLGRDAIYPELARLLVIQGADLLIGIAASPGSAQAQVLRAALSLRTEENQVFTAASFLLGPNYLGRDNREDFYGQSALLAPISMTPRGDGVLVQTGTNRTEGLIAADLEMDELQGLRATSRFRPRQEMHLGGLGSILAEMYRNELTIEQAIEQRIATPFEPMPEAPSFEPVYPPEPFPDLAEAEQEVGDLSSSVPEALSLPSQHEAKETE